MKNKISYFLFNLLLLLLSVCSCGGGCWSLLLILLQLLGNELLIHESLLFRLLLLWCNGLWLRWLLLGLLLLNQLFDLVYFVRYRGTLWQGRLLRNLTAQSFCLLSGLVIEFSYLLYRNEQHTSMNDLAIRIAIVTLFTHIVIAKVVAVVAIILETIRSHLHPTVISISPAIFSSAPFFFDLYLNTMLLWKRKNI